MLRPVPGDCCALAHFVAFHSICRTVRHYHCKKRCCAVSPCPQESCCCLRLRQVHHPRSIPHNLLSRRTAVFQRTRRHCGDARRRGAATYAHIPHMAQLRRRSARAEHELPRRGALDAATMKLPENQSNARARSTLVRRSVGARSKTPQPYRAQASAATAT